MISYTFNVFRLLLLGAVLALPAQLVVAQDDTDAADAAVKVVYHADFADPRRFSAMLTSINNMVTFYQNDLIDYDVRIVFVAHGIRFLTNDKLKDTPFSSDTALEERRDNLHGRLSALQSVQDGGNSRLSPHPHPRRAQRLQVSRGILRVIGQDRGGTA